MAYTPPINRRELGKRGVLDEDKFFSELATECGYHDEAAARDVYMAILRVLTKNLRNNGVARAPHLGDFALVKSKPALALTGKNRVLMDGVYRLKFYPKEAWRQYFRELEKRGDARDARENL